MFVYVIRTGSLYAPDGGKIGMGYSGNTVGLDNPAWTAHIGVGPLPVGIYTIGPAHTPLDHLGPVAMPLVPHPANEMFGRSGFFMHGDNDRLNHSASDGCLIFARGFRDQVDQSPDDRLVCVAEETDVAAAFVS